MLAARRHYSAIVAALLLMGAVFARSILVNEPDDSVAALYVIPIALLALTWGLRIGLAAGIVALALLATWDLVESFPFDVPDYLTWGVVFFSVAVMVGTGADQLRSARVEERRARDRNRAIIDAANEAFIATDREGVIQEWNRAAEQTYGWSAEEAVGRSLFETVIPPAIRDEFALGMRRYLETGKRTLLGRRVERMALRRDGSEFPIELSSAATGSGSDLVFYSFAHDISTRREAERLTHEFFGLISHELRTPLTSIIGYTEFLCEFEADALSDQGRHALEVVNRNAQRELHLVSDLLTLVNIDAGKFVVEFEQTDLREIAEGAVAAAQPMAARQGVRLRLDAAPVPHLDADPQRLGQVLDNLLTNAIKFSPEGGEVDVRLSASNGDTFVEVHDNGMGISPEDRDHLFERMFRTQGATHKAIPGTGLGLTIVKAIVDAHGGRIQVESEEGAGTTFRVELPTRGPAPPVGEPGEAST